MCNLILTQINPNNIFGNRKSFKAKKLKAEIIIAF